MADANHKTQPPFPDRFVTVRESRRYRPYWDTEFRKYAPPKFYPWIKLSGRWIEHAGFEPWQKVKITVEYGKLTVTPS
jgi:toxic protein SymE